MSHEIIEIDRIIQDDRCQCRVKVPDGYVDELVEVLKSGREFRDLPVAFEDEGGRVYLADGFCRLAATRKAGRKEIELDLRDGGLRAAMLHAVAANAGHGARRTNEDKRKAIRTMLLDEEWVVWTDQRIAEAVGCDHETVKAVRERMIGVGEIRQLDVRVGKDGKSYAAAKPPKQPAGAQALPPESAPAAAAEEKPQRRVSGDDAHQAAAEAVAQAAARPSTPAAEPAPEPSAATATASPDPSAQQAARKAAAAEMHRTLASLVRQLGDFEEKFRPDAGSWRAAERALSMFTTALTALTKGA